MHDDGEYLEQQVTFRNISDSLEFSIFVYLFLLTFVKSYAAGSMNPIKILHWTNSKQPLLHHGGTQTLHEMVLFSTNFSPFPQLIS